MKLKENNFVFKEKRVPDSILKDAPYAFVEYYGARDMEKHPGRMEWSGTTSCCNETVKGSDYGEDENCPCCGKEIIWDLNGEKVKEYLRPFEEEAGKYNDEQTKLCEERLNAAIVNLSKDIHPNVNGFKEFSTKVLELFAEDVGSVNNSYYSRDPSTSEIFSWNANFGDPYRDKCSASISISKKGVSIYIPFYDVYEVRDEDGHKDLCADVDGTYFHKRVSVSLPFVQKHFETLNTPEQLYEYQLKEQYRKLLNTVNFANMSRAFEMANKIETIDHAGKMELQKKYKEIVHDAAVNTRLASVKGRTPVIFEHDGQNGHIYIPTVERSRLEDGTIARHYQKNTVFEFELPKGLLSLPEEIVTDNIRYLSKKNINRDLNLIEKCKKDLIVSVLEENLIDAPIKELGAYEGAYEFTQFDMIYYFIDYSNAEDYINDWGEYDKDEIIKTIEKEISDGDLYLSATLDENDRICISIKGSSEFDLCEDDIYPLTDTENQILFDRIGEKIKEAQREYEQEERET